MGDVDLGGNLRKIFGWGQDAILQSGWPGFTPDALKHATAALEALVHAIDESSTWNPSKLKAAKAFGRAAWTTAEQLIALVRWHETGLDETDRNALAEAQRSAKGVPRDEYVAASPGVRSAEAQTKVVSERTTTVELERRRWQSASIDEVVRLSDDATLRAAAAEARSARHAHSESENALALLKKPLLFGRAAYHSRLAALQAESEERHNRALDAQVRFEHAVNAGREVILRKLEAELASLGRERESLAVSLAVARQTASQEWVARDAEVQGAQSRVAELKRKGAATIQKANVAKESAHTFMVKSSHVWGFSLASGLEAFGASTEPTNLRLLADSGICGEFGAEELGIMREAFALSNPEPFQALIEIVAQHFLAFVKLPKSERRAVAVAVATPWVEFMRCEGFLARIMSTDDGYRATSEVLLMDAIGRGERAEAAVAIGAAFAIGFRHQRFGRSMEAADAMIRADELVQAVCQLLGGPPNLRELVGKMAMQVGARAYHDNGSLHPARYE